MFFNELLAWYQKVIKLRKLSPRDYTDASSFERLLDIKIDPLIASWFCSNYYETIEWLVPKGITFQLWRHLTVKPIKSHFKAPTYFDAGGKCNLGPLKITQRKTWRASLNKLGSAKSHTLDRQIWISTKTVAIQLLRSGESVRVWLLYSFFFYYYTPADICRVATITFILYEKILHNSSVARSVKKIPHLWRIRTTLYVWIFQLVHL